MVVVTTDLGRGQRREVYVPAGDRSMAHHSYLSPDRRWVLVVEMDNRGNIYPAESFLSRAVEMHESSDLLIAHVSQVPGPRTENGFT